MSHHSHIVLTKKDIFPRVVLASISQQMSLSTYNSQAYGMCEASFACLNLFPKFPSMLSSPFPWAKGPSLTPRSLIFCSLFTLPPAEFDRNCWHSIHILSTMELQLSVLYRLCSTSGEACQLCYYCYGHFKEKNFVFKRIFMTFVSLEIEKGL